MREEMTLKEYEKIKKEIALEISEIFKSKNLSVSAIDEKRRYNIGIHVSRACPVKSDDRDCSDEWKD